MAHYVRYNTSDPKSGNVALTNGQTVTIDTLTTEQEGIIAGTAISDLAGNLFIDQGWQDNFGNTWWDYTATYAVAAGVGTKVNEQIIAPYARIRYTNTSASTQAYLRVFLRSFGLKTG